jgi:hypothetical protein
LLSEVGALMVDRVPTECRIVVACAHCFIP